MLCPFFLSFYFCNTAPKTPSRVDIITHITSIFIIIINGTSLVGLVSFIWNKSTPFVLNIFVIKRLTLNVIIMFQFHEYWSTYINKNRSSPSICSTHFMIQVLYNQFWCLATAVLCIFSKPSLSTTDRSLLRITLS